jgi:lysophospholipase L1-like esterase
MNNLLARLIAVALFVSIGACHPVSKYINSYEVLRWESDIRQFDSLNRAEISDQNTLLVTGSSSVRLWDSIHTDLAPYQVMQRGYGGARLTDYNYYAKRIIKPHPFKAILIFVANDISGGNNDRTPREMFQLYKILVEQIRSNNPGTPIFWIETTPTPSRWHAIEQVRKANRLIRDYCIKNSDLFFISTYDAFLNSQGLPDSTHFRDDMLHLNPEGYKVWAATIKSSLAEQGIVP